MKNTKITSSIYPKNAKAGVRVYDVDVYRQNAEAAGAQAYVLKGDIHDQSIPTMERLANEANT